jgi:hypothetical protein
MELLKSLGQVVDFAGFMAELIGKSDLKVIKNRRASIDLV